MTQVKIYSAITGEQLYSAPIEMEMEHGASIGCALFWGIENNKRICGSDLSGIHVEGKDLSGMNFSCCNLSGMRFVKCNLSDCNFDRALMTNGSIESCDLTGSTLISANTQFTKIQNSVLKECSFKYCNVHKTEFLDSDLSESVIYGTHGICDYIKNIQIDTYPTSYTSSRIQMGCENLSIETAREMDDKFVIGLDGKTALKFWRANKEMILSTIDSYPALDSIDRKPKRPRRTI